jgi:phage recombination protein Bet
MKVKAMKTEYGPKQDITTGDFVTEGDVELDDERYMPVPIDERRTLWTEERIQLFKDTFFKGATNSEVALALEVCRHTGLDPFSREIYFVKRFDRRLNRDVMTPQVSIDGFRKKAAETGEYEGQTCPEWCGDDGVWVTVWIKKEAPYAARIGVWRKNFREPCYFVARYREYVQTDKDGVPTTMWHKMPTTMLSKCAESGALRKSFPDKLSGLYTSDEMAQAENPSAGRPRTTTVRVLKDGIIEKPTAPKLADFPTVNDETTKVS